MAGTYSQLYIQIVFAVRKRESLISPVWENELYKYISGIVQHKGQKMLAINGIPNHIHIFIGMKPSCCLSDLVREIKKSSTNFINENKLTRFKFQWQEGFGAFSYNHSQVGMIVRYVMNQKEHHRKKSFKKEYIRLLREFDVEFKDEYLFDWMDPE